MLIAIGKSACVKTHLKIFDTEKKKVFMMNLKSLQELDSRQYKVYGIYCGAERDYSNFLPINTMILSSNFLIMCMIFSILYISFFLILLILCFHLTFSALILIAV